MAYTAWSVVFGEQPTAAKWNQLGTNDAGFKDGTNIDSSAITTAKLADAGVTAIKMGSDTFVWEKLADVTAGGTVTSISSGTITARKFLMIIAVITPTGGTLNVGFRFNNDSGANYAERGSVNGAADAAAGSLNQVNSKTAVDALRQFTTMRFQNESSSAKLGIGESVMEGTSGAANAPERKLGVYKWHNTSAQITRVDAVDTGGTGDIASGSRLIVLGHD